MVTSSNAIQSENLPPTETATHYHALGVHLQVAQWKNLSLTCLDPKEWGWKEKNGVMEAVKTDIEPALAWLLQVIRCNCKTDTQHPCGTRLCPCRKTGFPVLQRVAAVMGKGAKTPQKEKLKKINLKMNGIFLRFYKHSIER